MSHACPIPEKDLCPQVVPNAVEVVLVKQGLTDGPFKSPVGQIGEDLFSVRIKTLRVTIKRSVRMG